MGIAIKTILLRKKRGRHFPMGLLKDLTGELKYKRDNYKKWKIGLI